MFLPSFNYSKIFGDVVSWTTPHYNMDLGKTVEGDGFSWKAFISPSNMGIAENVVTLASVWYLIFIMMDTCIFLLLTWYFDSVLE